MHAQKGKVLVGMSGGVDSSVSAALLLEQGYEVIGAFMKNWSGDVNGPECKVEDRVGSSFEECGWKVERRDAMRVAAKLGIPFLTFDFETEYRRDVVEYMFLEFEAGRTPNPDVMCNRYMKFDLFLKEADKLGCDFIATGHYARTSQTRILKGIDDNKDQTYFLWAIDKAVLPRVSFPIGDLTKPEVREKARELGLDVAEKKDSTGICFIGDVKMDEFLKARMKENPGNVITTEGKVVGTHMGVNFYTIGQRHGLNIGGGVPYYVVGKNQETNELTVTSNFHPALFQDKLTASELNWFRKPFITSPTSPTSPTSQTFPTSPTFSCTARIRHRQPVQACTITNIDPDSVSVVFNEPQRAVTPGQSIVFYDGDEMIGGGIID